MIHSHKRNLSSTLLMRGKKAAFSYRIYVLQTLARGCDFRLTAIQDKNTPEWYALLFLDALKSLWSKSHHSSYIPGPIV